jgi:hypothetical protein
MCEERKPKTAIQQQEIKEKNVQSSLTVRNSLQALV